MIRFIKDKAKMEDNLFIFVVLVFVVSTIANIQVSFSAFRRVTLFNSVCSYLYIILWYTAAYILRNRKGWVWTILIVRWATIVSFCTTMILTQLNMDTKSMICSIIAYLPFGVLFPVYGGIHTEFLHSAWFYLVPISQALISALLFVRLRREKCRHI